MEMPTRRITADLVDTIRGCPELLLSGKLLWTMIIHCCRIVNVTKNKNIKNSLGATWNASHLAVRLCALRHWKRVPMPPTTQSLRHPLTRAHHIAPRIKTSRLRRKTNLQKSDYPKTRIKRPEFVMRGGIR